MARPVVIGRARIITLAALQFSAGRHLSLREGMRKDGLP
jgi:hypothetical protein